MVYLSDFGIILYTTHSTKGHMIKTRITLIIVVAMIGLIVNSASISVIYAGGGIMSLVANGAQDVYLTGNSTVKLQTDWNKLKTDMTKLQSEANKSQSTDLHDLVASASEDVNELQSDINDLQSKEDNLKSDLTEIQSEIDKNDNEESNDSEESNSSSQ
jgi:peptidoglycan hydrolase CwlO-like protein